MPNPMTNRNATSVPAASAAGPTTAGQDPNIGAQTPSTGPLPQSALAEALAKNFESQGAEETISQVQPSGNDGQTEPDQTEATDTATETQTATETTDAESPGQDPEDETRTEEVPTEETGTEVATVTETEDEPIGVKKRIGALLKKIEDLESRLEAATDKTTSAQPEQPKRPSTVDAVTDQAELDRREQVTMDGMADADRLLALCTVRPTEVERELRTMGAQLKDDSGEEDYSPERMVNWLLSVKQMFNQTLRAIPQRRKYLALYEREHTQALQLFPWLKDKTDERHAMFQNMLGQAPALKGAANHEYWVACAVRGHQLVQAELAKQRGNGGQLGNAARTTNPQPVRRPGPSTAATTSQPRRPATEKVKVEAARARVLKEGTTRSLSEFLDTTGMVRQ